MWDLLHLTTSGPPAVLSWSIITGSALPAPHSWPAPSVYIGGVGVGRAPVLSGKLGWGRGPQLPVVHRPGALGGISLATPTPPGKGKEPW